MAVKWQLILIYSLWLLEEAHLNTPLTSHVSSSVNVLILLSVHFHTELSVFLTDLEL